MKKIKTLFERNMEGDHLIRDEVVAGCEWVITGGGIATQKHDGTACLMRDGKLYKRYQLNPSRKAPKDFEPAEDVIEETGKQHGWVPVKNGPDDKFHREAFDKYDDHPDGTYELCGPKIGTNPEGFAELVLEPVKDIHEEPMTTIKTASINDLIKAFVQIDSKRNEPCMQCRNSGPHSSKCDIGKALRNARLEVGG